MYIKNIIWSRFSAKKSHVLLKKLNKVVSTILEVSLPRDSCHTGLNSTGFMQASKIAKARAKSCALWHMWTAFCQFCRWMLQFGCKKAAGMLFSSWIMLSLRVAIVIALLPYTEPFHLNSLVCVRENLWERCRRLSRSSLCWCLFKARVLVEYWFWYDLYPPSMPNWKEKYIKTVLVVI